MTEHSRPRPAEGILRRSRGLIRPAGEASRDNHPSDLQHGQEEPKGAGHGAAHYRARGARRRGLRSQT